MNQYGVLGRYLPVFRPHRRPDAARPVPRLHGRPAHPDGGAQPAPLRDAGARARVSAVQPADGRLRAPWLLYLAALFHDIAKGRGGDHSNWAGAMRAASAASTASIARRHRAGRAGWSSSTCRCRRSRRSRTSPIPTSSARFAARRADRAALVALYLLTVADIRGTSPKVWNAWKGKLLEDLFRSTRRLLGGETVARDCGARTAQTARRCACCGCMRFSEHAREALWAAARRRLLPAPRRAGHRLAHALAAQRVDSAQPDRARAAGAGRRRCEVMIYVQRPEGPVRAHLRLLRQPHAEHPGSEDPHHAPRLRARHLPGDRPRTRRALSRVADRSIEHELAEWIGDVTRCREPAPGRLSRQSRHFPVSPRWQLQPDERGRHYLLSVAATDRLGLLYAVARVLAQHRRQRAHGEDQHAWRARRRRVPGRWRRRLTQPSEQLQLESDLLDALSPKRGDSVVCGGHPGKQHSVKPKREKSRTRIGYRMPSRWSHSCCTTRA